jgi:hypothetical protein
MRAVPPPGRTRRAVAPLAAAAAALALAGGLVGQATAATSDAEVTISAGSLSLSTPNFQAQSATLTGAAQAVAATPASPWNAVDARGTGAAWSVVASATDLVSTGAPDRTIASANLAITTGTVTAGAGADAVSGMATATAAPFTAPTGAGQTNVSVLAAAGPHRGSYTFTPQLGITIPADALASYVGSPYTTTLTVTIS